MLTTNGSAMLTINRVHIWSPIYRHPIPITIKVRVNLAKQLGGSKVRKLEGYKAQKVRIHG
jgi:hypothetical protein